MKHILFLLLIALSYPLHAEEGGWATRDGKVASNTDSMKSINGFGGWLVVTPDPDWEKKWNTPPDSAPYFSEAKDVKYGQVITILPFFINPKTNNSGEILILCDIKVTRPDGSHSINAKGIKCASGKLQGNPRNIRLTSTVIKYIGEDGDLPGIWKIEVNITDNIRNVSIPLKTQFNLVKNG